MKNKLFYFKFVLLCLIAGLAYIFTFGEEKTIKIPSEIAIENYLEQINDNVIKVTRILSSIDSRETADSAVFQLAEIAEKNCDAYPSAVRVVTEMQAVDILHSIWTREVTLWDSPLYKTLKNEYVRLKNNNFYNSKSLQCMLSAYFVKDVGNSLVWAFSLTSSLEYTYLLSLEYTYLLKNVSYPHIERNKAYVAEFVDNEGYSLPPNNDDFTLLYLDAMYYANYRGPLDGIIKPLYTLVRGEDALFVNCLCDNFEFNNQLNSILSPENCNIDNLIDYNPLAIRKLNKDRALRLMNFYRKCVIEDEEYYVYHLNQPFKSRFLIIHYKNTSDYPHAIQFTNDLSPFIDPI